jgi:hypothetical protein
MASDAPRDLPDSLAELLDQHDPETLAAIRDHCDRLLEEYDLEEDVEERTYG